MTPDTRETLDPAWEKLAAHRSNLTWNLHYCELYARDGIPAARSALEMWERDNAEEWNRLKPWYEVRL